ncbi:MAG: type II toxin-antitoxin system RelE/ParE family toxin [bacterium]
MKSTLTVASQYHGQIQNIVQVSITRNFYYICAKQRYVREMRYFETIFLEQADTFISELDNKLIKKILYNIDLAEQTNDPRLFKKLEKEIWEFRIKYAGLQIRLLGFWDKGNNKKTLVIATNGFIKKTNKTPKNEIERALKIREKYFNNRLK